ncbi:MAG TPA: S46 family peptidase [Ignavibacteriales bacterium]|nr:S46 family peptidase [Ignavibacteriales bacterium]
MKNLFSMNRLILTSALFLFFIAGSLSAQASFEADTVKAQKYDTGKMWAFEFPPFDYLKEVYNFNASQEWFDDVRLSALRIPGCTASFVSEDGLIMTNNHCARGIRRQVQKEGEDLANTAFIARTLEEERKIPNYSAEQLVYIKDVTKEVQSAISSGKTEKEKIALRDTKLKELKDEYEKQTSLKCDVVSYYNGSLFFVQGFRIYNDVRLVFQPEENIAYFGGDPDNFTFPRYNLDCTFLRIYGEDGKPVKSEHFFKWSANGAQPGELVFTVGNPGSTNRLRTVAQLEYLRDIQYRNMAFLADNLYSRLDQLKSVNPQQAAEYEKLRLAFSNGQKNISNTYKALNDPYLLARKKDFEKRAREFVASDPELEKQYGHVWKTIETTRGELRGTDTKIAALSTNPIYFSRYLTIANALVTQARQSALPDDQKDPATLTERYQQMLKNIYPDNFDPVLEKAKLEINIDYITMNLGKDHPWVKKFFNGRTSKEIAGDLISKSVFKDKKTVMDLFKKSPEEILALNDPFISYYAQTYDELVKLKKEQKEAMDTENVAFGLLGQIIYKMYGTSVTPDANRTLRLSDGVLKGYNYNGTTAQVKTTFFGLYDKYFGFEGKYPFNLPARWQTVPKDLDLNTPFDFVSTNDIVGGNSGSAVINKNAEVIGLAFDGNIESLQGNFIYLPTYNRTVAVDSKGMYEAIKKVYKNDRLADELKEGKLQK